MYVTLCLSHPLATSWLNLAYCLHASTNILLLRLLVVNCLRIILVLHLTARVCWLHELTFTIRGFSLTNSRLDGFLIPRLVEKVIVIMVIIILFLFIGTISIKWVIWIIMLHYQCFLPFRVPCIVNIHFKAIWAVWVIIIGWGSIIKR